MHGINFLWPSSILFFTSFWNGKIERKILKTFYFIRTSHCYFLFISSTRPTFKQLEQAVQYTYKLRLANRDSPPNESSPFREILVKLDRFQEIGLEEWWVEIFLKYIQRGRNENKKIKKLKRKEKWKRVS